MADIHPFRAFRYDPLQLSLSQVATQPYDKITSALQDRYYAASPYNLVRIILGRREENDNAVNNVYSRAAGYFRDWRQEGILRQDSNPSLYIYSQCFKLPGSTNELERRGFIGLGRIEDYSAGVVFRHEQTLAKPKADRLDLLRATRAHFGQIFMLYEDSGEVESLLATNAEPDISVTDEYGVIHRVWQVSDPGAVSAIRDAMSDKKLIIADGHHRYETALTYRNERRAAKSSGSASESGAAPYEFVMMTFVNMNSPGLLILPTHRLVHGLASFSEEKFRSSARAFFDVDEIDASLDARCATTILREAGRAGTSILAVTAKRAFLLHHPNPTADVFAGEVMPQKSTDFYPKLLSGLTVYALD